MDTHICKCEIECEYDKKHSFIAYGKGASKFVFIVIPGLRSESVPGYKLICNDKQEIHVSLDALVNPECIEELNSSIDELITVEDYLKKFSKTSTTLYNKKLPDPPPPKKKFRFLDNPREDLPKSSPTLQVPELITLKENLPKKTKKQKAKEFVTKPVTKKRRFRFLDVPREE